MQITFLIPILVSAVGLFLLIRLRFFFILHPVRTIGKFLAAAKDKSSRRSLMLALAGTLGVGNIFGVAAGIMIGGAGCVFWLFVSSLFAMVIKYSEALLVFDTPRARLGMSGALESIFQASGRALSLIYALLTVALALLMGSAMQSGAVIDVAKSALGIPSAITAIILVIPVIACIGGGGRKIEQITEIVIPLTTIIYIIMSFFVIFSNFSKIPEVISEILSSVFRPCSMLVGGGMGALFVVVKEGFARGILSNEAGTGTSALGHARSSGREPAVAGLFGMCEVFFDTTVLCMLTAFVVLLSVEDISAFSSPMSLVFSAFCASLGEFSGYLLLFSVFMFAFSTVICWYYYGRICAAEIAPALEPLFTPIFIGFLLFSEKIPTLLLISSIDLMLLFMSLITLLSIVKKSGRIKELTRQAFDLR